MKVFQHGRFLISHLSSQAFYLRFSSEYVFVATLSIVHLLLNLFFLFLLVHLFFESKSFFLAQKNWYIPSECIVFAVCCLLVVHTKDIPKTTSSYFDTKCKCLVPKCFYHLLCAELANYPNASSNDIVNASLYQHIGLKIAGSFANPFVIPFVQLLDKLLDTSSASEQCPIFSQIPVQLVDGFAKSPSFCKMGGKSIGFDCI